MQVQMPHDALKELGDPPEEAEILDPREELLEEARGVDDAELEETEAAPEEPLSEIDEIRARMADQERSIKREIARERERRRRAVRKAEVLERQVSELIAQQTARETPTHVRLEHDEEGNPILSRDALARLQAPPKTPPTPQAPAQPQPTGSNSYQRMKDSLVDEDATYADIFTRLEAATKDLARGLEEAAQDGETLNTADEVAEYLETSDLGSDLKRRYPEIEDVDEFLRAVQSSRVARKMAERIHRSSQKAEKKTPEKEAPARVPTPDLTGAVRNRIREKASQVSRSRPTSEVVDGISLETAAQMDPEQLLALPAATRERLKAAMRKQFA